MASIYRLQSQILCGKLNFVFFMATKELVNQPRSDSTCKSMTYIQFWINQNDQVHQRNLKKK
jgi:hypothetical protein